MRQLYVLQCQTLNEADLFGLVSVLWRGVGRQQDLLGCVTPAMIFQRRNQLLLIVSCASLLRSDCFRSRALRGCTVIATAEALELDLVDLLMLGRFIHRAFLGV